jgi:hypothetical protein
MTGHRFMISQHQTPAPNRPSPSGKKERRFSDALPELCRPRNVLKTAALARAA